MTEEGRWEAGLETTSGSEVPKHVGMEREKHGKEIIERGEDLGVLFGMSQGTPTSRWIVAVGTVQGHRPCSGFAVRGEFISAEVHLCFHCLISLCS